MRLRTNGCAYFSALIILEAQIFENPLDETVEADLQLIEFAINVLDQMSDASTIMAMKRMNVVASEIASRAKSVVFEAQKAAAAAADKAASPSERQPSYTFATQTIIAAQNPPDELQWSWSNAGVEAWPRMDVYLVRSTYFMKRIVLITRNLQAPNQYTAPMLQGDISTFGLKFPEMWTEDYLNDIFNTTPFNGFDEAIML